MPRYPATAQMIVPVQVPRTTKIPADREYLADVWAVMKKLGPGVTTPTPQIDKTLKNISILIINCPFPGNKWASAILYRCRVKMQDVKKHSKNNPTAAWLNNRLY